MQELDDHPGHNAHGKLSSSTISTGHASKVHFFERQQRLDDSAWLVGWYRDRLPDSHYVWILIAQEASSKKCRVLRAHHSPDARCLVDDLDSALGASRGILHEIYLSDSESCFRDTLLQHWALFHGILLRYVPWCQPRSGSALETCARAIRSDVLERVRPKTLAQLNEALIGFGLSLTGRHWRRLKQSEQND